MKKTFLLTIFTLMCMGLCLSLKAQVTIGNDKGPESFSVLELISNQKMGMRLPQMTTDERDDMTSTQFGTLITTDAKGLMIYNTTIDCIEYWNGEKWISNCEGSYGDEPCVTPCDCDGDGFIDCDCFNGSKPADCDPDDNDPCIPAVEGLAYTRTPAASVIKEIGVPITVTVTHTGIYGVNNLSIDGGKTFRQGNTIDLIPGLVGENKFSIMVNNCPTQIVEVIIEAIACSEIQPTLVRSCIPYMHDYQSMVITAYHSTGLGYGEPLSYQWYVNDEPVPGETNQTFTFYPKNIELTPDELGNRKAFVKISCDYTNLCGTKNMSYNCNGETEVLVVDAQLGILTPIWINHFNENGDLVPFAMANINLGAEYELDACKVHGDYYQWGRMADGHEKRESKRYPVDDSSMTLNGTVSEPPVAFDANGQILPTHPAYGCFIKQYNPGYDYNWRLPLARDMWGNDSDDFSPPKAKADPCPAGWKVPSRRQWQSIYKESGDGTLSDATANEFKQIGYVPTIIMAVRIKKALSLPMAGHKSFVGNMPNFGYSADYYSCTVMPHSGEHANKILSFRYSSSSGIVTSTVDGGTGSYSNPHYSIFAKSIRCIFE